MRRITKRKTTSGQKVYCGPAAIAMLTGLDVDVVVEACNRVTGRKVRGLWLHEMHRVCESLGFRMERLRTGLTGLLVWQAAARVPGPTLLHVRRHYVVVDGLLVGDQHQFTLSGEHWCRRRVVFCACRVQKVRQEQAAA